MHGLRISFAVALTLFLLPQLGFAASKDSKERSAKKACLKGDPEKGVGILTDLYVDTGELTYIFNQGRCFEQNRRYEDAIGRFREYLIKGNNVNGEEKAEAEKHIAACQSYLGKSEPREAVVPEVQKTAPQGEPPRQTPPVMAAAQAGVAVQTAQADDGHSGSGLRIAGITLGSVGAAALITGVILNLKVNSMSSDLAKPESYMPIPTHQIRKISSCEFADQDKPAFWSLSRVRATLGFPLPRPRPAAGIHGPHLESCSAPSCLRGGPRG